MNCSVVVFFMYNNFFHSLVIQSLACRDDNHAFSEAHSCQEKKILNLSACYPPAVF
jgi:hypothetical protein